MVFWLYPENVLLSGFNLPLFVNETFFFNDCFSAFLFIGEVIFCFFFCFFSFYFIFFSSIKFSPINVILYLLLFSLFLYCYFIFFSVYFECPPLYYLLNYRITKTAPDLFFSDLLWNVSSINRSCILCYCEYSSELGDLVDMVFLCVSYFYSPNGRPHYLVRLPEVIQLKRQCINLLLDQCPNIASDLIINFVKNINLADHIQYHVPRTSQ